MEGLELVAWAVDTVAPEGSCAIFPDHSNERVIIIGRPNPDKLVIPPQDRLAPGDADWVRDFIMEDYHEGAFAETPGGTAWAMAIYVGDNIQAVFQFLKETIEGAIESWEPDPTKETVPTL
ncbi:MAG: hypothetical protein HQ581_02550 [Planctomycetes bacterium]|nr:hypothetical protein [Planctomycetota bacterium]